MIPALVIFLSLNFSNLIPDINIDKIINSATSGSSMEIASDASFANQTLEFNAGQTIYVRVTTENDGSDKHVLNLRDNNYSLITTYSMAKSGDQFLVNFPAPNAAGIYSLEANITSAGSVANFVRTIEVNGGGADNSQVNVKIENKVNTGNQSSSTFEESKPTSEVLGDTSGVSPDSGGLSPPGFFASIWSKITEFFEGIFRT